MAATTVARLIFNSIVPEKYRSEIPEDHPIGSKEVHDILQRVAEEEPERYKDISFKLLRLGSKGAVETGSSFSMKDLESPIDKKQLLAEVAEQERNIFADKTLDAEKKERELAKLYNKYSRRMPEMVYDASISKGSNLAKMVASGARGNKSQLNSNIGADFLVMDQNNIPVPIGIKHSYAEGMDPAEYFAASYGTRAGLVATKFSTQNSGFLCLSRGCDVRMADFSTKKIEDIQVGDTVLGANKEFQTFPVNVTSKFENGVRECHRFTFATQEGPLEVACTASHKFLHFSGGEYAMAPIGEVDLGTSFPVACPRGKYVAKLDSFIEIGEVETFDIEVDHPDHLFVLGTGLVVSNSKQINASAMDLLVTQDDCQTDTGIPVGVNERDNVGAVLAKGVQGYSAGTLLTPKILNDIKARGKEQILVRSAMTCQSPSGICAKCAGIRERGRFPALSDSVGLAAASALSEPLSQSLLSTKHCIFEDELVRMADFSTKRIKDIVVGDLIMGADMEGNTFQSLVTDVIDKGEQEVYRYSYRLGSTQAFAELMATPEHLVLGNAKISGKNYFDKEGSIGYGHPDNQKMKMLKAGDPRKSVSIVMPTGCAIEGASEPMAMLYGALLGDGIRWTTKFKDNAPRISCADPEFAKDMDVYLSQFDLKMVKCKRGHDWRLVSASGQITPEQSDDGRFAEGFRSVLKPKLIEWEISEKYCHEKYIPDSIKYGWDKNSLLMLVAGYIATDGSITKTGNGDMHISFGSTSRRLLEDLKFIIEKRLCVYGDRVTGRPLRNRRSMYKYSISRRDQTKKLVRMLPTIPGIKKVRAAQLLELSDGRFTDPFYRCPRFDVELIGPRKCYDLTVQNGDNLFVMANGIIVHNSAGVANASKVTGFPAINALFQVPETFPDKASLSEVEGSVDRIEELPQGGFNVVVNEKDHYVSPEHQILVKKGDKVEAGDRISSGTMNPADVVRLKGIGAGRLSLLKQIQDTFHENGINVSRRNAEIVTRAVIDHVKVDDADETSEFLPDEIVEYGAFAKSYVPREDSVKMAPQKAIGKYLEKPVMHYSIGTKVTPSVAKSLGDMEEKEVLVSDKQPNFSPRMVRLMENPSYDRDWMSQLGTSYVQKNLKKNVVSGNISSDIHGVNPLPALAYGKEFGKPPKGVVGY